EDLPPGELHLEAFAQRADHPVGVDAPRALDRLRDDIDARVTPGGAELRLLALRPVRVALRPVLELRVQLLEPLVVPGEAARVGADRRLLRERVQLVRIADGRRE